MALSLTDKRVLAKPAAVVTWGRTTGGKTARMGARTAAHVDYTQHQLSKKHPGAVLHIIQSAYNTGVAASAGTHDKDGCIDVSIEGLSWMEAQGFLRSCGWAAWYRFPPAFGYHIHMISLGCPGPLGEYVDGGLSQFGRLVTSSQITDYYHHAFGLKGQHNTGVDHSWFPSDIDKTIFDFPAWLATKEILDMNNVQLARTQIETAIKAVSSALTQLRKVPKKRVVVWAQIAALNTALSALKAVLKRLPAK